MVTEVEESMPWIDWVGPRSFLRVSVARMRSILRLSGGVHIRQMERVGTPHPLLAGTEVLGGDRGGDFQEFPASRGALQAQHAAGALPDERRSGEQRRVL